MENLPDMSIYIMQGTKCILPLLALWILLRCVRSMLRGRYEPETWGYLGLPDGSNAWTSTARNTR